jgi:hypothetical protein
VYRKEGILTGKFISLITVVINASIRVALVVGPLQPLLEQKSHFSALRSGFVSITETSLFYPVRMNECTTIAMVGHDGTHEKLDRGNRRKVCDEIGESVESQPILINSRTSKDRHGACAREETIILAE